MDLGLGEILVILVVVVLLFGPSKVPQLGDALGRGIRGFRKAMRDDQADEPVKPQGQLGPAGGATSPDATSTGATSAGASLASAARPGAAPTPASAGAARARGAAASAVTTARQAGSAGGARR